ncbi:transporter [Algoriphagus sp. A40]|uniref:transporter n=1 Tax=Algoriphagus sp. A40 TaxID=1945863 RepID=UPI0014394141|nr:transporter [Algoriphagus sp. A40]
MQVPVGTTTAFTGFTFSRGEVVTDPTLPVQNIKAKVESLSFGVSHSFGFLGKTSQILLVLPYSWAQVSGDVAEQYTEITRSGLADMRFRFSTLLIGGKAGTVKEISQAPRKTILGFGLNIVAPTGQFFPEKLVNLGTNRWSFRPELGLSQPIGKRWLLDFYSGLWLFTNNNSFYPGSSVRSQEPMGTFQAHFSYNIKPLLWIAINTTYYLGGKSSIDSIYKDDRQDNSRIGITAVIPTGRFSSLKFAASTGAVVRVGQDFNSFTVGWQKTWLKGVKK